MYTLSQCLYLLRFAKSKINFKTKYIFRESSPDEPQSALQATLLKCPTDSYKDFSSKFKEIQSSKTFEGIELTSNDWAVLSKHVFMNSDILSGESTRTATTWKLLQDKLRTLFAQIYLDYAHRHQNQMNDVFKDTPDRFKEKIQSKFLDFLGQLYQNGDHKSVKATLRFFELAALTKQEPQSEMDDYGIGVVFSPSLLHALKLQGSFLAPCENPMQTASNFKLEYAFGTLLVTSLLTIPELTDRRAMMEMVAKRNQGERFEVEHSQMQQLLWAKRPMRLAMPTPPLKNKSKKNTSAPLMPTFEIADVSYGRERSGSTPSISLTQSMKKLSLHSKEDETFSDELSSASAAFSPSKTIRFSNKNENDSPDTDSTSQERRSIRRTLSSPRLTRKSKQVDS